MKTTHRSVFVMAALLAGGCEKKQEAAPTPPAPEAQKAAAPPTAAAAPTGDWRAKATAHLDERSLAWIHNTPMIGENFACAMNCHTTGVFLMSRPIVGQKAASPAMDEVRAKIEARVNSAKDWKAEAVPFYGHRQKPGEKDTAMPVRKAMESIATESVMNAATLAMNDVELKGQLSPIAQKAFDQMWQMQRADGGWDWLMFGLQPWEAGDDWGAGLAALAVGAAGAQPAWKANVDKLTAYLHKRLTDTVKPMKLHDKVMLLWASSRMKPLLTDAQRTALVGEIEKVQRPDGGWSLSSWGQGKLAKPDADSDGYATAYATLALCQAESGDKHSDSVQKGLAWLRKNQQADGSWIGKSVNEDQDLNNKFMSDAATGYASMALSLCGSSPTL